MTGVPPVPPESERKFVHRFRGRTSTVTLSRCREAQTSRGDAVAIGAGNLRRKVL
jgi:hypothetical protein